MTHFRSFVPALCAGLVIVAWGCGATPPVAVDQEGGPALTKRAPSRHAFETDEEAYTASTKKEILDIEGGALGVRFPFNYFDGDEATLHSAKLWIPEGALGMAGDVTTISMTAEAGSELEDVELTFGPSGTRFAPPAVLTVVLYGEVSAEDVEEALHISGTGEIESIETRSTDVGPLTVVTLEVSGFSRYNFDDDGYMSQEAGERANYYGY